MGEGGSAVPELERRFERICTDAGAGGYQAFPDVCRCANGDLLCVFYAGYAHVSGPTEGLPRGARIAAIRSTDEGLTWGPASVVADTPWDDRDPHICCLSSGRLVCNFFTYYPAGGPPREAAAEPYKEIWLATSADDGHTWSEPELIPSVANDHFGVGGPIREMPGGLLAMPIYEEHPQPILRTRSAVIFSEDGGRTWSEPTFIDAAADDNDEPDVVALPDRWLCVMRTNRGESMFWSESVDVGRGWTPSREIGFSGQAPYLLYTSQKVLLLAHRGPGTSLHYSLDDGRTWGDNVQIDTASGAYPSMLELSDGRVLIVYYEEGEGSAIRAQFMRVGARRSVGPTLLSGLGGVELLAWPGR